MNIIVGITGASGAIYARRLLKFLVRTKNRIHVIISDHGFDVFQHETGEEFNDFWQDLLNNALGDGTLVTLHDNKDFFAPIASGSYKSDGMVIIPCSMSTIGALRVGFTENLIIRAADVMIKEKRKIIIVPRETPLSTIHLTNLTELSRNGVIVIPAMPYFYHCPATIADLVDSVVLRILDHLGVTTGENWEKALRWYHEHP